MKRSLKLLMSALAALVLPALGWAEVVYTNALAGEDTSLVINEVAYKATKTTAVTALTEDDTNNFDTVIYKDGGNNDTRTHTFSMWVKVDSLSNDQTLWWVCGGHNGEHGGYAVKAMADGQLRVGKTNANATWNGGNYVTRTFGLEVGVWAHVTLVVTKRADARTADFVLYKDGSKVSDGSFPTNLNGDGGTATYAQLGANIYAAGVKVYNEAITAETVAADYADRENLTVVPKTTSTTISAETATVNGLTWDNGAPTNEFEAIITAEKATMLTMDAALTAAKLTTAGSKITFTAPAENAGTLTSGTTEITADTDVSGITASLGATTVAADKTLTLKSSAAYTSLSAADSSTLYYTDAVSTNVLNVDQGKIQRYRDFTTSGNIGNTAVKLVTGEGDVAKFNGADRHSFSYAINGGKVTTNMGQLWLGAKGHTIELNSGIVDFTSINEANINNDNSAALLFSWTDGTTSLIIRNGIFDARNTSLVAWGTTSFEMHNGFLRTKGFRRSFNKLNISGGTVEIGTTGMQSGNLPNVYGSGAPVMSGTLRAIDDATVNVNLWSDSTGSFQAVDGKTLTISSTFKGASSYTIGAADGTAKTQTRADDGTYSETDIAVNGTVKLSGASFEGKKTFTAKSGTLDLTAYDAVPANLTVTLDGGTVLMKAGAESGLTVPDGSTLKLVVSATQIAAGYTSTVASGSVTFVKEDGTVISENVEGNTIKPGAIAWSGETDTNWATASNWVGGVIPTAENNVVFDLATDLTVTIPADATAKRLTVGGAKLTLAGGKLTATNLVVSSALETPVACIECGDIDLEAEATLTLDAGTTAIGRTTQITGGTVVKKGTALLTLFPTVANVAGAIFDGTTVQITEGNLKLQLTNNIGDPWIKDTTFNFANGTALEQYGWVHGSGTITLIAAEGVEASAFQSNLGESCTLRKLGAGKITCVLQNTPCAVVVEAGTLLVKEDGTNACKLTGVVTVNADATLEANGGTAGATIENTNSDINGTLKVTGGTVTCKSGDRKLGNFEVASGATLKLTQNDAWKYNNSTTGIVNGTLEVASKLSIGGNNKFTLGDGAVLTTTRAIADHSYDFFADNTIEVKGAATIKGLFGTQGGLGAKTLTIKYGANNAKLTIADAAIMGNQILTTTLAEGATSGALEINSTLSTAKTLTIASGVALSGIGSWGGPVTLANGATIDASAGKVTIGGNVTAEGTVTVTLPAEPGVGTKVLACANAATLDLTKLSAAPAGLKWVAVDGVIELATAAVCKIGDTEYETLAAALAVATSGTEITMVADSDESITLPAGVKLIMGEYTVASVKDVYGANLTVGADGNYIGPVYVATVTAAYSETQVGYTSFQEAVTAAEGFGIVTLLDDLTLDSAIIIDNTYANVTIDLGGNKLTGAAAFYVKHAVMVGIKNGTIETTGVAIQICDKTTSAEDAAFDFSTNPYGNASVTLDSTLTVTSSTDNCVLMYNGAVLSTAAVLTSSGEYATIQGSGAWSTNPNNATMINITGGSVTSTDNHAIYHPQPGTLTITGGTITGKTGIEMRAGTLAMEGGTVTATGAYVAPVANGDGSTVEGAAIALSQHTTGEEVTANITGGTITADSGKTFVVANTTNAEEVKIDASIEADVTIDTSKVDITIPTMELKTGAEGGYTLEDRTTGALIGNAWHATLAEAVAAANAGDTITLLGDVTAAATLVIDKAITIDGNGKKLTYTGSGTNARAINVKVDGAVAIRNLTIKAENAQRGINVITYPATVTLTDVTVIAGNYAVNVASSAGAARVTISGGEYTGLNVINVAGAAAEVTITDATINCGDATADEEYAALCLNKEAIGGTIAATDCTINVATGSVEARNGAEGGTVTINGAAAGDEIVAVIEYGEFYKSYATFADAIAAATAGETIKLIRNVALTAVVKIEKDITIDLNGKTVTAATGKNALWAYNADLIITDTATGGKVVAAGAQAVRVGDNSNTATAAPATFTLNSGAIEGQWAVTIWEESTVTVNGGTITGSSYGISGNGYNHDTTITVTDGTISGGVCGIYHPQAGTLTIEGGEITGATGIEMRAGTITMTAGTVKTTADAYDEAPNGNGSTTVGAAIALSQHGGVESITVNITGGEIVGSDSTAEDAPVAIAITNTTATPAASVTGQVTKDATLTGAIEYDSIFAVNGDDDQGYTISTNTTGVLINDVDWCATLAKAVAEAEAGDTLKLLADETAAATLVIGKSITIDGNGKKLTSSATRAIRLTTANTTVAIQNLNVVNTLPSGTPDVRGISIDNVGNIALTLTDCTVTGSAYAVNVSGGTGSTLTIDGGAYEGLNVINVWGTHTVTIDGATLTSTYPLNTADAGACVRFEAACTATIKNTTFNGANAVAISDKTGTSTITEEANTDNTTRHVAKVNGTYYNDLTDAITAANGETVVLLASGELKTAVAANFDLNGWNLKGTFAGTLVMNGGKYYSADDHYMAGPEGYYVTTDATFKFGATAIEIAAGNVSISKDMNTLPGQTLTVAAGANFTVPAEKTINVLNSTIIVNGTLTINGTVKLGGTYEGTAYTAGSITADEGLTITSGVDGYDVVYAEGKYTLVKAIAVSDEITINGNESDKKLSADAVAALQAIAETAGKSITAVNVLTEAHADAVDSALQVFTEIVTIDAEGVATVDWDFGISAIEPNEAESTKMDITVKVQKDAENAAGYAADTKVAIVDAAGDVIGEATTSAAGEAVITVELSKLKDDTTGEAKTFKAKASK